MFGGFINKLFGRTLNKATMKDVSGFDRTELDSFMRQGANVASQSKRQDITAPEYKTTRSFMGVNTSLTNKVSQEQAQDMLKAFRIRQDDVFSRRARPGVSQQTRKV